MPAPARSYPPANANPTPVAAVPAKLAPPLKAPQPRPKHLTNAHRSLLRGQQICVADHDTERGKKLRLHHLGEWPQLECQIPQPHKPARTSGKGMHDAGAEKAAVFLSIGQSPPDQAVTDGQSYNYEPCPPTNLADTWSRTIRKNLTIAELLKLITLSTTRRYLRWQLPP